MWPIPDIPLIHCGYCIARGNIFVTSGNKAQCCILFLTAQLECWRKHHHLHNWSWKAAEPNASVSAMAVTAWQMSEWQLVLRGKTRTRHPGIMWAMLSVCCLSRQLCCIFICRGDIGSSATDCSHQAASEVTGRQHLSILKPLDPLKPSALL